ncbi:MAG: UPF0175 family protein [Dehalococcoidia bacterium]
MNRVTVEIDESLVQALALLDQPLDDAIRETIVLELYRRGTISSGKAAQLLGTSKLDFIQYSGRLGIPYFRLTDDESDSDKTQDREHLREMYRELRETGGDLDAAEAERIAIAVVDEIRAERRQGRHSA